MNRFSKYVREGSAVYRAPCGKSILQSMGGDELEEHVRNCEDCINETKEHNISSERPRTL